MTNAFLTREAAPISDGLWELLDKTVLASPAASSPAGVCWTSTDPTASG